MHQSIVIDNRFNFSRIGIIFILLVLFFMSLFIWLNSRNAESFRTVMKKMLMDELVRVSPPPPGYAIDVIYILAGNQSSLELKSRAVSEFLNKGQCKNIWIMSLPGLTEYSRQLGRNWTKNEYSQIKLNEFGVPSENVEFVKINEGFFGTLSEADHISALIKKKQYKSVLLIAQPYHTRRVKISFDKFLAGENIIMYIQDSGEQMLLRQILLEYLKLKVYQYFLIS